MENIKIFSKGWNYSQDGPGNRLIYHFQGCNFFCPWCSNPEGISRVGTLKVNKDKLLDEVCPFGAIKNRVLNRSFCKTCIERYCISKNRNEGIVWSCKSYTITEIIEEIKKSKFLFYNEGGVTITGGEPTLQFEPLKVLLFEIRNIGVNAAIETNGSHIKLPELFDSLDLLIMDFKHYDVDFHRHVIGIDNKNTIDNLKKASVAGIKLWIRIPLIPGFNDGIDNIKGFIKAIKTFNQDNVFVELLKYHEYGKIKWAQSGMDYTMKSSFMDTHEYEKYQEMFMKNNIRIINT